MIQYYAHSENDNNEKHLLSKHLLESANLMESFACRTEYKFIFKITGLMHDLGKYQSQFQNYLENGGRRGSVSHASWGAGYASLCRQLEASFAIDGHHKGLPDKSVWQEDVEPYKRGEITGFDSIKNVFLQEISLTEKDIENTTKPKFDDKFQREIFIRYLFSALTDSDWLSTEGHFQKEKADARVKLNLAIDEMIAKLEAEFAKKSTEGEINQLRNMARIQVLEKAKAPCGFFSLALPTGMGKTLTSLAWALQHAKKNKLKRIIIVLPYINIIDQTAQTLKEIFGEEWVLEHHSSYNEKYSFEKDDDGNYKTLEERKKLACENWDYPIIVTTTVQFFESLFSNRPSKCRKNHNIAESVVIFDEVQTLPKEVITPTLRMLEGVQSVMRTSFLFCTATQPAFEKRKGFDGIKSINPLIENPAQFYKKTKRVKYNLLHDLEPIEMNMLLASVDKAESATLVIFNTKKTALEFYNLNQQNRYWDKKYHLSTAMCPFHRKDVILKIREDLTKRKKILVVSTQLIEAGVDFDFPVVYRAIAPLEAVIQSAGRCNREGRLGEMGGKVFLFKLKDSGMPDQIYRVCAGHAEEMIRQDIRRLHDHKIFNEYYAQVINLYVESDKYKIEEARNRFDFKVVNDGYRIIRNATEGLFIYNFSDKSKNLLHSIEHKKSLSKDDYRKMQHFVVQVYDYFIIKNAQLCRKMPQGFMVWYGNYDPETGLSTNSVEADKLII